MSAPKPESKTGTTRRSVLRGGLASLAGAALGACKIEPILDMKDFDPSEAGVDDHFPSLPPKIPDQLEDAEATLRALTDEILAVELPRTTQGDLRERPVDSEYAVHHFQQLLASFGLAPAGPRGGWRQAIEFSAIEPTGALAVVTLRSQGSPLAVALPDANAPRDELDVDAPADPPAAPGDLDGAPASGEEGAGEGVPDRLRVSLVEGGAFRQLSSPRVESGLLPSPLLRAGEALSKAAVAGRVVWLRGPKKFDLLAPDAPERVAGIAAAAREAGAIACVILTSDEGPGIERFRERWARSLRRAEDVPTEALALVGLLDADTSRAVSVRLEQDPLPVLDVDLATHERRFVSHNLMARTIGRERPDETVVLTCAWDTSDPLHLERDTLRLLTTLATMAQLASWQRRSTRSHRSLTILLTADGGLGAGQLEHARWAASEGARPTVVLGLDRPSRGVPSPLALVTGYVDEETAALATQVLDRDGRETLRSDELSIPELGAYLRHQHLVMTVGEPPAEAIEDLPLAPLAPIDEDQGAPSQGGPDALASPDNGASGDSKPDPLEGLHADVRLLRNLMLALGADHSR